MEGKRVEMKIGKEKPKRKTGWLKDRKKRSSKQPVQDEASEACWWRADPEKLSQDEIVKLHDRIVKLHDRFVQFHNALCDHIAERLAGSSSNMVAPEKVQPMGGNKGPEETREKPDK